MRLLLLTLLTVSGCIDGNVDDALELSSTTTDGEEAERPEPRDL